MEFREKVIRAKHGDDNAFYEIINEKKEILYKTAFTYVKNKEDALDLVHTTVVKAYTSIKWLNEPSFFNTWLMRILINSAMDMLRKNKKDYAVQQKIVESAKLNTDEEEDYSDLYYAVDKLKYKYKTVIILRYFQDLTLNEIADIMECPLGTVKTNLHRALKELKLDLEEVDLIG